MKLGWWRPTPQSGPVSALDTVRPQGSGVSPPTPAPPLPPARVWPGPGGRPQA